MPNKKNDTYEMPAPMVHQLLQLEKLASRSAEPRVMQTQLLDLVSALKYHKALGLEVHEHYLREGEQESEVRRSLRSHVDENTFWTLYAGKQAQHYVLEIDFPAA